MHKIEDHGSFVCDKCGILYETITEIEECSCAIDPDLAFELQPADENIGQGYLIFFS